QPWGGNRVPTQRSRPARVVRCLRAGPGRWVPVRSIPMQGIASQPLDRVGSPTPSGSDPSHEPNRRGLALSRDGNEPIPALLFAVPIFLAAALLFLVQPMTARMVLPQFGGTPAVWTTCVLFFQLLLLAGYAYAHLTWRILGRRAHVSLQLMLLLVPLGSL